MASVPTTPGPDSGALPEFTLSRRGFLGGVAGVVAAPASAVQARATLSVMTWNFYLGVNLFRLQRAETMDDVRTIAGRLLEDATDHPYEARAAAIAKSVADSRPDVLAFQEVGVLRIQRPSDFDDDPSLNATTVVVDALEILAAALSARGLSYTVATETATTEIEVPADTDDGDTDVRLTDRDVILVRDGIDVTDARSGTLDAGVVVPMAGTVVPLERGYCIVDVSIDGAGVAVVNTHLESAADNIRHEQARELLDRLPPDQPTVLAGDFNSGPSATPATYETLTIPFEDAFAEAHPDADGFTCCQPARLQNEDSRLTKRVDAVLYRGGLRVLAAERVGADPDDRVPAEVDGEKVRVWPSDHAGVVAAFEVPPPTPTPTSTVTPEPTQSATATPDASPSPTRPTTGATPTASPPQTGFGVAAAIGGLLAALVVRWRREA